MTKSEEQLTVTLEHLSSTLEQVYDNFIYLGQFVKHNEENRDAEIHYQELN